MAISRLIGLVFAAHLVKKKIFNNQLCIGIYKLTLFSVVKMTMCRFVKLQCSAQNLKRGNAKETHYT